MKLFVTAMMLTFITSAIGCGSAIPSGSPPPPPPAGTPGGDDDPNGGVGFDDPSVGRDGA